MLKAGTVPFQVSLEPSSNTQSAGTASPSSRSILEPVCPVFCAISLSRCSGLNRGPTVYESGTDHKNSHYKQHVCRLALASYLLMWDLSLGFRGWQQRSVGRNVALEPCSE